LSLILDFYPLEKGGVSVLPTAVALQHDLHILVSAKKNANFRDFKRIEVIHDFLKLQFYFFSKQNNSECFSIFANSPQTGRNSNDCIQGQRQQRNH
jgi:hypothetical protein